MKKQISKSILVENQDKGVIPKHINWDNDSLTIDLIGERGKAYVIIGAVCDYLEKQDPDKITVLKN